MARKFRVPQLPKPGVLKCIYGKADKWANPSLVYLHNGGGTFRADARILMHALETLTVFEGRTLAEELTARGYDITTLKFTIEVLPESERQHLLGRVR